MHGDFMVSLINFPGDPIQNTTVHTVYIPEGVWYDFATGKANSGP